MTAITITPAPRKRNRAIAVGLAAVVLTAGIAGAAVSTTGAWFTATKTATGNSVTAGTLQLGALGDSATGLVEAENAFPMTDSQAVVAATAVPEAVVKIRNVGTLPLSANVALKNLVVTKSATAAAGTIDNNLIKVSLWNATTSTWSTPVTMASIIATTPAAFNNNVVQAGDTKELKFRVFLDSTAGDAYQGLKIAFEATANAIQTNKI